MLLCSRLSTSASPLGLQDSWHAFKRDSKQQYFPQELPDCFPPRYLYTCTVGRNRSKARCARTERAAAHTLSITPSCQYVHLP